MNNDALLVAETIESYSESVNSPESVSCANSLINALSLILVSLNGNIMILFFYNFLLVLEFFVTNYPSHHHQPQTFQF